jgi:CelD/BcsL family acetyltransferase involved in cellulose biosynthesis
MEHSGISPRPWRLESASVPGPMTTDWSRLTSASHGLFGTPEWIETWEATRPKPQDLRLVSARDGEGRLAGIAPLVIERIGPLRVARFAGYGEADILGPVVADGVDGRGLLREALYEVSGWDVFLGERMRMAEGWGSRPEDVILRTETNPHLALQNWPDWDAYLATRTKKLRRELRHDERALAAIPEATIRRIDDPADLPDAMDALFALHELRFGDASSFLPRASFHRRFASVALKQGWLRLTLLQVAGQPIAARYDFLHDGVYYAYNAGRDPAWRRESVGLVLRAHTIRAAIEEGARSYRFLRGDEGYKSRFGTTDDPLVTIAWPRTWLGRQALAVGARLRDHRRARRMILGALLPRPASALRIQAGRGSNGAFEAIG